MCKKTIEWSFEDLEFNSKWKFVPLCPIKWRPSFVKSHESLLLISNTVKGAGQFQVTKSPWMIMKNAFYFILTNWMCYWKIRFSIYYAFSLSQIPDIREVWRYLSLKDGLSSISQKNYRATILWTKKLQTFPLKSCRHFLWELPS